MSKLLIQHYLAELSKLRQVGGTHRESVVREAFKDLLKGWARSHDLTFVPEYEIESPAKERRYVDGALLYGLRLPFGYWEAKDEKDDLDMEIEFKFKRGYPTDNIVFEDSREAVLIQNRREVVRCAVDDVDNDNNKNREYADIDARIKDTYIKASTAQKTKLYDMYARFFRWASDRIAENGVVAFVTNRSYIESRTFDGFRDVVAREFNEIHLVDLGGDVRANPKLSGTRHNVFGIQTGVAIGFLVKRAKAQGCRVFYARRPEMETAEEKLAWLSKARLSELPRTEIRPDAKHNWLNLTDNDFDSLMPVASKAAKAAAKPSQEKAIFKLVSNGIVTARDEWMTDFSVATLRAKAERFCAVYEAELERWHSSRESKEMDREKRKTLLRNFVSREIKWTEELEAHLDRGTHLVFDERRIRESTYRPFVSVSTYYAKVLTHRTYLQDYLFPIDREWANRGICFVSGSRLDFAVIATNALPNYAMFSLDPIQCAAIERYESSGARIDNITDWALKQFRDRYKSSVTPAKAGVQRLSAAGQSKTLDSGFRRNDEQKKNGGKARALGKEDIFRYVYTVLHDPLYREKYAQNLKREFPRIPFYADFWRWSEWGRELMDLHIGYESVEAWPLARIDVPDEKARKNGAAPKALLKANKDAGSISLDSETTLSGIPHEAWDYKLGNRCALEWILDQYKEKTPKDPTIRAMFNTRFADYKGKVIDLIARVTRVSVQTQRIVDEMKDAPR